MNIILMYTQMGHFEGMTSPKSERQNIDRDKWGYPVFYATEQNAIDRFNDLVNRAARNLDSAAKSAYERNPTKTVGEWRAGLLKIHPLPSDPKLMRLVEIDTTGKLDEENNSCSDDPDDGGFASYGTEHSRPG